MSGVSNLDKTRMRIVRKGVTCDYSGLRLRVQKVRCGVAICETFYNRTTLLVDCSQLRVVA
jgi:hypothetical protein